MVILRIWSPSRHEGQTAGYSSVAVASAWGEAYMSVRAATADGPPRQIGATASLADDLAAAGTSLPQRWQFSDFDEARVLRLWHQCRGSVLAGGYSQAGSRNNCFKLCDRLLYAAQGQEVEMLGSASLRKSAHGSLQISLLVDNYSALSARADACQKIGRW